MNQEAMKFMEELQEFVHKAQKFLQASGGNFGQRNDYGYGYGMRDNYGGGGSSGGSSGGNSGGSYGQRQEPWMQQGWSGQGGAPNWGGPPQGMPGIDPRYFM